MNATPHRQAPGHMRPPEFREFDSGSERNFLQNLAKAQIWIRWLPGPQLIVQPTARCGIERSRQQGIEGRVQPVEQVFAIFTRFPLAAAVNFNFLQEEEPVDAPAPYRRQYVIRRDAASIVI